MSSSRLSEFIRRAQDKIKCRVLLMSWEGAKQALDCTGLVLEATKRCVWQQKRNNACLSLALISSSSFHFPPIESLLETGFSGHSFPVTLTIPADLPTPTLAMHVEHVCTFVTTQCAANPIFKAQDTHIWDTRSPPRVVLPHAQTVRRS